LQSTAHTSKSSCTRVVRPQSRSRADPIEAEGFGWQEQVGQGDAAAWAKYSMRSREEIRPRVAGAAHGDCRIAGCPPCSRLRIPASPPALELSAPNRDGWQEQVGQGDAAAWAKYSMRSREEIRPRVEAAFPHLAPNPLLLRQHAPEKLPPTRSISRPARRRRL
jgi:hypothetical protein